MKDFHLYLTTRGRADRQITLSCLPKKWRKKTYLVVDKDELKEHKKLYEEKVKGILVFPGTGKHGGNLSDKRQWVLENAKGKFICLLDDDLKFSRRKEGKLVLCDREEVSEMFEDMYRLLSEEGLAHCAVSPREGNCFTEGDYAENTRMLRVLCFNAEVLKKEGIRFDHLPLMSDFEVVLSLFEKGYPNKINFEFANGQRKSNDDGGCSLYRTPELMEKAANGLKKLHPYTVNVRKKTTDKPWAGFDTNVRTDVDVQWSKAFEIGKKRKKSKGISNFLK